MADLLSAMREFRYLDEKRLLGALAPAEQLRWEELRALVSPQTQLSAPSETTVVAPVPLPARNAETPAMPATDVEPPFVDADDVVETTQVGTSPGEGVGFGSAFDKAPIPQAPLGQEPALLEFAPPASDFEPTQGGPVDAPSNLDFDLTQAAPNERPETDFDQTVVAPLPLSTLAPAPVFAEPEPTPEYQQAAPAEAGEYDVAPVAEPAAAPEPLRLQTPSPAFTSDHTAVIPPSAVPWRASPAAAPAPSVGDDAAEADFFKHFDSPGSVEGPSDQSGQFETSVPQGYADSLPRSWPQPQAGVPEVPLLEPEVSPLAAPDPAVVAPYVPGQQRVVVHTLEGLQKRGFLTETDLTRGAILLAKQDGGEEWLNVEELKAVFFLVAPDQQPSPAQGQRVSVALRDGRTLHGTALDPSAQGVGFFLFPEEGNARIDRIFLYLQAVKDIAPG